MQNIKLLVFDIDGTLIYHRDGDVLLSTKEAIKLAHNKNIHTIIATGRCPYFISEDVKNTFKDADYFITMNGTLIVDNKMNTIIKHDLTLDDINKLIKLADKYEIAMGFKFEDVLGVYRDYHGFVSVYTGGIYKPDILKDMTNTRDYHLKTMPSDVFIIGDQYKLELLAKAYPNLTWVRAYDGAMEAYKQGISKAKGIEWVLEQLNITWENVMTFGDGENDIEMTEKAKIGVIMGNAKDSVKAHADYVTDDVLNNGIYNALKYYEII